MASETHLIGIAGPSGSGKTQLAHALCQRLGETTGVIALDSYYRNPDPARPRRNFDHPTALDARLLTRHLRLLASGRSIERPVYDFRVHRRLSTAVRVEPAPFVVVEGLLTLYWPELRRLLRTRIYLRADDGLCLSRRVERDTRERGRTEASVRHQWRSTVRPMCGRYVEPTAAHADAVFDGSRPLDEIVDAVTRRFGW